MTTTDDLTALLAAATPGPWAVSLTDDTVVIGPDRLEVAAIDGDYNQPETWPIMEANAALIARAPDMAAALIEAEKALEAIKITGPDDDGDYWLHLGAADRRAGLNLGPVRGGIAGGVMTGWEVHRRAALAKLRDVLGRAG